MEEEDRVPVLLSQTAEWSDVKLVPQDDGPNPVVPIMYTKEFEDAMGLFRAVYVSNERSPRSLELTRHVILLNAGNYTVWHFRRLVLDFLGTDLREELDFVEKIANSNSKNYQIWHHRRWVAEKLGTDVTLTELVFTRNILSLDAKNYHAWSHRQWVLQTLGGWENELDYCDQLLQEDPFNNSAWNQRYFVISRSPLVGGIKNMRESEVQYSISAILTHSQNESPWRYLRGLFKGDDQALVTNSEVAAMVIKVLETGNNHIFALSMLLDLLSHGFNPCLELQEVVLALANNLILAEDASFASIVCTVLEHSDSMRCNYWKWRRSLL